MSVRILIGDARGRLRELPGASVHCVVTSPPYFGLRDYGVEGQIGLEASPEDYVAVMVEVFREVRRVLRDDGTLWLNIGDSYASGGRNSRDPGQSKLHPAYNGDAYKRGLRPKDSPGIKPKDLLGVPWQLAFALRADGWYLRSEIVWHKPNPMPESVTDRPTSAHEKVFLLSKSTRYFYDADAVREEHAYTDRRGDARISYNGKKANQKRLKDPGDIDRFGQPECGRNLRNVWTIATAPFSEAHFATFPPALVEPCIKAGTSEKGVCPKCGAPWARDVEFTNAEVRAPRSTYGHGAGRNDGGRSQLVGASTRTIGWSPSCDCKQLVDGDPPFIESAKSVPFEPVPATVLDPFGGSGTVGLVADRLGRDAILIELNPEYAEMAKRRLANDAGMFSAIETDDPTVAA